MAFYCTNHVFCIAHATYVKPNFERFSMIQYLKFMFYTYKTRLISSKSLKFPHSPRSSSNTAVKKGENTTAA